MKFERQPRTPIGTAALCTALLACAHTASIEDIAARAREPAWLESSDAQHIRVTGILKSRSVQRAERPIIEFQATTERLGWKTETTGTVRSREAFYPTLVVVTRPHSSVELVCNAVRTETQKVVGLRLGESVTVTGKVTKLDEPGKRVIVHACEIEIP